MKPIVLCSLLFLTISAYPDDTAEAKAFMEKELDSNMNTIRDTSLSPAEKRALVERHIRQDIALGHMAVESLGSRAATFNLQEFADYSEEFQQHLLNLYLLRAATFVGDEVDVTLAVQDPDSDAIIVKTMGTKEAGFFRTRASSSSHRAAVDYHLIKTPDGWNCYSFFHHLGHGIGLDAHETPRLNPYWDDTFQPGDVVAVEPGLYGDDLRAGLRLEQNYLITESGAERLSNFPLEL